VHAPSPHWISLRVASLLPLVRTAAVKLSFFAPFRRRSDPGIPVPEPQAERRCRFSQETFGRSSGIGRGAPFTDRGRISDRPRRGLWLRPRAFAAGPASDWNKQPAATTPPRLLKSAGSSQSQWPQSKHRTTDATTQSGVTQRYRWLVISVQCFSLEPSLSPYRHSRRCWSGPRWSQFS
jgi:hypothetical protein